MGVTPTYSEPVRENPYNKSYRVDVPHTAKSKVLDPNNWPEGIVIKAFRKRNRKQHNRSYHHHDHRQNHQDNNSYPNLNHYSSDNRTSNRYDNFDNEYEQDFSYVNRYNGANQYGY